MAHRVSFWTEESLRDELWDSEDVDEVEDWSQAVRRFHLEEVGSAIYDFLKVPAALREVSEVHDPNFYRLDRWFGPEDYAESSDIDFVELCCGGVLQKIRLFHDYGSHTKVSCGRLSLKIPWGPSPEFGTLFEESDEVLTQKLSAFSRKAFGKLVKRSEDRLAKKAAALAEFDARVGEMKSKLSPTFVVDTGKRLREGVAEVSRYSPHSSKPSRKKLTLRSTLTFNQKSGKVGVALYLKELDYRQIEQLLRVAGELGG